MKEISIRSERIDASIIQKAFESKERIKNLIDLTIGQPDFDVPKTVKEIAINNIRSGFNGYTSVNGIKGLRDKISRKLNIKNGINVNPEQILVTSGTTGGIFLTFMTLLNYGDEVIIMEPYFSAYIELAKLCGAKVRRISTFPNYQPNINRIEKAISLKTKIIILNSPNNPTGAVYSAKTIKNIIKIARQNNIYILSDEVYEDYIYKGKHFSPGSIYKRTITINGFSKSAGMTGWRIGYATGPKKIINIMAKLQQFIYVCAPSFAQKAAITAINTDNRKTIKEYKIKRDIIYCGLKDYYQIMEPHGSFYIFLKTPFDEDKFVQKLLENKIAVMPGKAFCGKNGYIRISYATNNSDLKEAVKILTKLAN